MRQIIIILSVIIFLCSSEVLGLLYPNAETDYDEFLKYYYLDDKINEMLLTLLFLFASIAAHRKLVKAFAIFGFTITFASMIDKVFLNVFDYLYTDILILIFAVCMSYYVVYKNK